MSKLKEFDSSLKTESTIQSFSYFLCYKYDFYPFIALSCKASVFIVSRIRRFVWHSLVYMDITRRFRGRPWCGWRSNGHFNDIEQVLTFYPYFLALIFPSIGAPPIYFFWLLRWQYSFQSFISSWLACSPKSLCTSPWFLRFCLTCIYHSLSVFQGSLHLLSFSSGICIYYWIIRYYCEFISHGGTAIKD